MITFRLKPSIRTLNNIHKNVHIYSRTIAKRFYLIQRHDVSCENYSRQSFGNNQFSAKNKILRNNDRKVAGWNVTKTLTNLIFEQNEKSNDPHFLVSVFFIKKSLYIVRLCLHVIVVKINEIWIKKLRENWPGGRIIQKFFVRHRNHKARLVDDINVVWKKSWSVFWMKRYPLFRGWSWWFLVQMHWWIVCLSLLLVQQIYWNRREKLCHISIYLISSSLAHPKEPTCIFFAEYSEISEIDHTVDVDWFFRPQKINRAGWFALSGQRINAFLTFERLNLTNTCR